MYVKCDLGEDWERFFSGRGKWNISNIKGRIQNQGGIQVVVTIIQ